MPWENYRKTYYLHLLSLAQVKLLAAVAGEVLKDFPRGLPNSIKDSLVKDLTRAADALGELRETLRRKEGGHVQWESESPLFGARFDMLFAKLMLRDSAGDPHYDRLLYSQQLVMFFAHLDAFIGDSVRTICKGRPEVLKSDRKIDWEAIIDSGGWEQLLNQLVERYVFEFGWQPVQKRIEFLEKEFGLEIDFPDSSMSLINEAENIRHIVIHNGGRISQEFISRTTRSDVAVGEIVPLSSDLLEKVYNESRVLSSAIMKSVAKKFFNVQDSDLPVMFHKGDSKKEG